MTAGTKEGITGEEASLLLAAQLGKREKGSPGKRLRGQGGGCWIRDFPSPSYMARRKGEDHLGRGF